MPFSRVLLVLGLVIAAVAFSVSSLSVTGRLGNPAAASESLGYNSPVSDSFTAQKMDLGWQ